MGLLNFNSEDAQIGLGLLAAGGARSDGANFGQRLLEGVGQGERWKAQQQAAAMQKMQIENYASEIEARKLATVKDARMQAMVEKMMGGGANSQSDGVNQPPMSSGVSAGTAGTSGGAAGGGGIMGLAKQYGIPQEAIQADMIFNGGKKISELLASRSTPKWENINGNLVNTNAQGFAGGFQPGMNASANGQVTAWQPDGKGGLVVGAPAGALDTARAYGQVSADQKPIKVFDPATQREVFTTEGSIVRGQAQPGVTGSGYNGGTRDGANAESIKIMQSELRNPNLSPQDKSGIMREIQRMQIQSGSSSGNGLLAAGPSAAELAQNEASKAKAIKQVEADIKPTDTRQNNIATANYLYRSIDKALNHPGLSTATGLSGTIDPRNYIPGTDAKDFQAIANQIKGGAFLQAFESLKSGGAVSEIEGEKATNAIARLDKAQSTSEYKSALQDFQEVIGNSLSRMRESAGRAGTPVNDANTGSKKPEQQSAVMSSLPTPNVSNKGRRIRDTVTGEVFISNGMQWKKGD